jgi:threonine synthase
LTYVKSLVCRGCFAEYPIEPLNVCEMCFGPLEITYDYEAIRKNISRKSITSGPFSVWRYDAFLPVSRENAVDIGTGFTPLTKAENLGSKLGLKNLYIKNDSVNPTFSFKDRPVTVTATKALEFGFDVLACVSTGNLMGSVAAHGAKAGMKTIVFFPENLEQSKQISASIYGPVMVAVDGNYDQVNRLGSELADNRNWAFVNINMRPFYAEGSKTLGYEVAEQLGWRSPDNCIVPAASGELYTKIWKGLKEFSDVGLIDKPNTRMFLAQAEGCSPIVSAYKSGDKLVNPVIPDTLAKSLAIGNPASGPFALETIIETNGGAVATPEEEIVTGIELLAETEGIFTETAGGVVVSSLKKLAENGEIDSDEVTIIFITGNGLKTQEVVRGGVNLVKTGPSFSEFEHAIGSEANF